MYGTPTYSEIDPTPIIAFTFPILFGIMFGDIGHGLTLIIAGLIGALVFKKRKKQLSNFSWIIFFCGWAAFFIGFLYGEFFGRHEIELFGTVLWNFEENPIRCFWFSGIRNETGWDLPTSHLALAFMPTLEIKAVEKQTHHNTSSEALELYLEKKIKRRSDLN